jgi:succinate dehydrogenase / fumarate reductase membrane anchor subunit
VSQEFASDRKRVEGLGGGRHGAGNWIRERVTSIALLPLGAWGLWSATRIMGTGYNGAVRWLEEPVNAVLLTLLVLTGLWHMELGLKNVVEDYLHKPFGKGAALLLNLFLCLLLAAAAVFSILKVAFGAQLGVLD